MNITGPFKHFCGAIHVVRVCFRAEDNNWTLSF